MHWFGRLWPSLILLVLLGGLRPATARAQAELEAADSALQSARFEEAVTGYDNAEARTSGLVRAELVRIYRGRAVANAALRRTAEAERDLRALLALDPGFDPGPRANPSFRRLLESARANATPLTIEVESDAVEGGFEIRTTVQGDPGGLVRSVRVTDLSSSDGAQSGRTVVLPAGDELRYAVEVMGPGGAVLITEGEPGAPRIARRNLGLAGGTGAAPTPSSGDDSGVWIGLGVAVGVVAAAAAVLIVALLVPSGRTQPGRPMEVSR